MPFLIRQRVDLHAQMSILSLGAPFQYGDARAHEWRVEVARNGNPTDLSAYTISLYIRRADNSTVGPITGTAGNGYATVIFPAAVYNVVGDAVLLLRAEKAASGNDPAETVTLAALHARIVRDTTDTIASEEVIVPNINELLSQIAAMEAATEAAGTQAQYAKDQGDYAKNQGDYAKNQGDYAKNQGDYAKNKGDYADAKGDYADEKAEAAAAITQQLIDAIIPQFSIGTVNTVTPAAGASVTITGTARAPVLNLNIPRGLDGESSVQSVGGVAPDNNSNIPLSVCGVSPETDPTDPNYGNIPLTPSNLGAVPDTRTINGHALNANITLSANDVSALPSTEPHLKTITRYHIATNSSGTWTAEKSGTTTYSYKQTISCQGITADDVASASFDTSQVTLTTYGNMQENFLNLWCVELAADSVIVHSKARLTMPILLEVIR